MYRGESSPEAAEKENAGLSSGSHEGKAVSGEGELGTSGSFDEGRGRASLRFFEEDVLKASCPGSSGGRRRAGEKVGGGGGGRGGRSRVSDGVDASARRRGGDGDGDAISQRMEAAGHHTSRRDACVMWYCVGGVG